MPLLECIPLFNFSFFFSLRFLSRNRRRKCSRCDAVVGALHDGRHWPPPPRFLLRRCGETNPSSVRGWEWSMNHHEGTPTRSNESRHRTSLPEIRPPPFPPPWAAEKRAAAARWHEGEVSWMGEAVVGQAHPPARSHAWDSLPPADERHPQKRKTKIPHPVRLHPPLVRASRPPFQTARIQEEAEGQWSLRRFAVVERWFDANGRRRWEPRGSPWPPPRPAGTKEEAAAAVGPARTLERDHEEGLRWRHRAALVPPPLVGHWRGREEEAEAEARLRAAGTTRPSLRQGKERAGGGRPHHSHRSSPSHP